MSDNIENYIYYVNNITGRLGLTSDQGRLEMEKAIILQFKLITVSPNICTDYHLYIN